MKALVLISRNDLRLEKLSSERHIGLDEAAAAAAVATLPCSNCFNTEVADLPASVAPDQIAGKPSIVYN